MKKTKSLLRHALAILKYAENQFNARLGWIFTNGQKKVNYKHGSLIISRTHNGNITYYRTGCYDQIQHGLEQAMLDDAELRNTVYEALLMTFEIKGDELRAQELVNALTKETLHL